MIKKFYVDYPAFTGLEKRKVYLYLPKGYRRNRKKRYPVLYMFDGHNIFYDSDATYGKSWGLKEYLDKEGTEIIVCAVSCHFGENNERIMEYSPYPLILSEGEELSPGYGDDTFKWFIKNMKPKIDRRYRTLTDRENTFLMGSSMGGLMTVYGLIKYNNIFSKGAALSPFYMYNAQELIKEIEENKIDKKTTLYTDYGADDLITEQCIPMFCKINTMLIEKGVNVTSRIIENGLHNEATWEKQLPFAMATLMYKPLEI
ncbi:MAG: alpha/beta hydrolase [Erysipelotrichaceae bacterium]